MSRKPFDKFINKVESGAKKKERIRQEKKKIRAEKNAYFDEQKKLARERRAGNKFQDTSSRFQGAGGKVQDTGYKKEETGGKKRGAGSGEKRTGDRDKSSRGQDTGHRLQGTSYRKEETGGPGRSYGKQSTRSKFQGAAHKDRGTATGSGGQDSGNKRQDKSYRSQDAGYRKETGGLGRSSGRQDTRHKPDVKKEIVHKNNSSQRDNTNPAKILNKRTAQPTQKPIPGKPSSANGDPAKDQMPLNKFIAWSGVCGRREAADLIKAGKVIVNNQVIKEPPFRVNQSDSIKVNGKKITIQKNLVYILLNKPKDYITTTDDPEGRKTVMDLVKRATTERVFPVGRLDRNTTGVLLLTNDGELAQRLTHPKYEVKKIYEVRVDKPVTKQQLDKIASGITLEDGFIQPDAIAYADSKDKSIVGIEIHSGRNRIVRRIFEHLGFKVKNLDRVMYGIFTKKNVDRGKWRLLTEKEIRLLKHLNTSFANKKSS